MSSAKLTLEGLLHWQDRLTSECATLVNDIEASEAMAERWCGKCVEGLHELRALRARKERDLERVSESIAAIQRDADMADVLARKPGVAPLVVIPRSAGHPDTGALLNSAVTMAQPKSPAMGRASGNTRELSRAVARQSSILVNSPDPTRRLVF